MLEGISILRHDVFAHNKLVRNSIDNDVIEHALDFCFRTWHLLDQLLTDYPMIFQFKSFHSQCWKMKYILSNEELTKFREQWQKCQEDAKYWMKTPIKGSAVLER